MGILSMGMAGMRDKANEILKRDFPDIRKELEPSKKESLSLVQPPMQKKKGMGL
jgi:hypothetical protein